MKIRRTYFALLVPIVALFYVACGTNTTSSIPGGVVRTTHINQYYSALNEDFVARNSSGVPTDLAGDLGQSSIRWDQLYARQFVAASGIYIDANGSNLRFGVGGGTVELNPAGKFVGSVGQQVSSSSGGAYSTASGTYSDITNLSVTLTTYGRPVILMMIPDNVLAGAFCEVTVNTGNTGLVGGVIRYRRGADVIGETVVGHNPSVVNKTVSFPCGSFTMIDVVAAGTYNYFLQAKQTVVGTASISVANAKLVAFEL